MNRVVDIREKLVISMGILIVSLGILTGCSSTNQSKILQEPTNIQEILVVLNNGESLKISNVDKIKDVVTTINKVSDTNEESTQDVPNVDKYGKIIVSTKENKKTLYYYTKGGKYYLEEPYVGIYRSLQDFNKYFSSLK